MAARGTVPPPAHLQGPPPAHTGGFGEPTCLACHAEFEPNPQPDRLTLTGWPERYTPSEQYLIEISLVGDDMVLAGFQAAIRFADGPDKSRNAGRVDPIDHYVGVTRSPEGVEFVQHTNDGARQVQSGSIHWQFIWTAPRSTGAVRLDVAANDANGDNSPLGDFVYTASRTASGASAPSR